MSEKINPYLTGATRYQVIAPCLVAKLPGNQERYVYKNGMLPASTLPSQIEILVAQGMIRPLKEVTP